MAKRRRRGTAVGVKGYNYTRKGKRIHVAGYSRKKPKKTGIRPRYIPGLITEAKLKLIRTKKRR